MTNENENQSEVETIDLSGVDTQEEINEVLEDLAEIEDEITEENIQDIADGEVDLTNESDEATEYADMCQHADEHLEGLENALKTSEAKVEKLLGLMMLTDESVKHIVAGVIQDIQIAEFRKEFPD